MNNIEEWKLRVHRKKELEKHIIQLEDKIRELEEQIYNTLEQIRHLKK